MTTHDGERSQLPGIRHPCTTLLTIAAPGSGMAKIVDSLETVKGVVRVKADPAIGMASVLFDAAITSERAILEAVRTISPNHGT